jgi:exodeoxyribonuclease VII small subunit
VILGKNAYDYQNPAAFHPITNTKMEKKERLSFEEALSKLEIIISKLEDPAVSLEESINLYEEGMKLTKLCSETLEEAELKIRKVNPNKTEA